MLQKRGSEALRSLGKSFRNMDSYDGNNAISRDDLVFGLREVGINLSRDELEQIFVFFDVDGAVNLQEFLTGIRGKPNERRQSIIDKCFLMFDKDGNGYADISDVRNSYNCVKHPKVLSGELSEDQVFSAFLKNFNDVDGKGSIERKEWNDYYSAVSSVIYNDDHFVLLMKIAWNLE